MLANCCLSVKTEKLKIHSKLFWNGRDPKYFRFLWRYRLEQSTRRGLWRGVWARTLKTGLEPLYALPSRFYLLQKIGRLLAILLTLVFFNGLLTPVIWSLVSAFGFGWYFTATFSSTVITHLHIGHCSSVWYYSSVTLIWLLKVSMAICRKSEWRCIISFDGFNFYPFYSPFAKHEG
jgi:hypothetical protein